MSAKNVQVARYVPRSAATRSTAPSARGTTQVGRLVSILSDEQIVVAIPGVAGRIAARLAVPLTHAKLHEAIALRQGAVIIIDGSGHAIIIGLIERVPEQANEATQSPTSDTASGVLRVVEADVDGKRVRIVGGDEIVLECGSASITLRRNGRVVIRGTYLETDSEGTNRIKGAAVRIN